MVGLIPPKRHIVSCSTSRPTPLSKRVSSRFLDNLSCLDEVSIGLVHHPPVSSSDHHIDAKRLVRCCNDSPSRYNSIPFQGLCPVDQARLEDWRDTSELVSRSGYLVRHLFGLHDPLWPRNDLYRRIAAAACSNVLFYGLFAMNSSR